MSLEDALSRPIRAATELGDDASSVDRFFNKRLLLTGESAILRRPNGRDCLLTSLRLLVRICPHITVSLPDMGELVDQIGKEAKRITFGPPVIITKVRPRLADFDAILNVGTQVSADLPLTAVNSNGWIARVSSGHRDLPADCSMANPIAAAAAACLGAAEVFKRLLDVKLSRGPLLDRCEFSLASYRVDDGSYGPGLPDSIAVDLLLVGAGAIGNGMAHVLSLLPITGQAMVVDPQDYERPNLGTCVLIGPDQLGSPKAKFIESILKQKLACRGFSEDLQRFAQRLDKECVLPTVVISGLDNINARYDVQDLWPDMVIDGAVGVFNCQASRHSWNEDSACLKCMFRRPAGPSAELIASRATGLSIARVAQADEVVTEQDVQEAHESRKEWLRENLGKPICSVVQAGIAAHVSAERQRQDFQPSVPYVACMSACLVVGELVKHVLGFPTGLDGRFQFDMLRGPAQGLEVGQRRRSDCICTTRRRNIDRVRASRISLRVASNGS